MIQESFFAKKGHLADIVNFLFSGQEEVRYPSGVMEISFSDGSVKKISSDGSEDIQFPDGTHVAVASNGDRTLVLANGQKEFHTAEFKVRNSLQQEISAFKTGFKFSYHHYLKIRPFCP